MLKERTQHGTCPTCGRPYVAAFQADDAARTVTPMVTVNCPHNAECNATFPLGVPNGAEVETLRIYTPSAWAELRKTEVPKPLTAAELAQLELQSDVTGLSTVDVRRLLADNRRLRQRVTDPEPRVPDKSATEARPSSTVADASRPLTEKELADFERVALAFRQALHVADEIKDPGKAVIESSFAMISMRLVGEIRRLRQLVADAEPYVPNNEQTRLLHLPARLKAEIER